MRLEWERLQPWDGQLDLAGYRHQLPLVQACADVQTVHAMLVTPSVASSVRLRVKKAVNRVLHRLSDKPVQVVSNFLSLILMALMIDFSLSHATISMACFLC